MKKVLYLSIMLPHTVQALTDIDIAKVIENAVRRRPENLHFRITIEFCFLCSTKTVYKNERRIIDFQHSSEDEDNLQVFFRFACA